jgi:hypothetical protein
LETNETLRTEAISLKSHDCVNNKIIEKIICKLFLINQLHLKQNKGKVFYHNCSKAYCAK